MSRQPPTNNQQLNGLSSFVSRESSPAASIAQHSTMPGPPTPARSVASASLRPGPPHLPPTQQHETLSNLITIAMRPHPTVNGSAGAQSPPANNTFNIGALTASDLVRGMDATDRAPSSPGEASFLLTTEILQMWNDLTKTRRQRNANSKRLGDPGPKKVQSQPRRSPSPPPPPPPAPTAGLAH